MDNLKTCPVCGHDINVANNQFNCAACGLQVAPKSFLGFKSKDQYIVQALGDAYSIVAPGVVGHHFTIDEIHNFTETVYSDEALADFATGNYEHLNMPASTLAQILLEQLRETCYVQINGIRRGFGPALAPGGNRFPQGLPPTNEIEWKDRGNLFLTNARLVLPSNTFTFIRMDRKLVGLKTFENGIAVQRRGENHATYFIGCRQNQAALAAAYLQGKVAGLRKQPEPATVPTT